MQKELFQGTVKDLVKEVLEGGNSLVFTYGVTNAGKTFTFLGGLLFVIVDCIVVIAFFGPHNLSLAYCQEVSELNYCSAFAETEMKVHIATYCDFS